jgi:DNA-binding GntR family transcriptional regulator
MAKTSDLLIEKLTHDISVGTLLPGDRLEEAELAKRFDVSRTPIREAIRSMVDSGLLETRPRKGAIVRVLDAKELLDLFEVAAELEGMACRLASASLTDAHAKAIQQGLDHCNRSAELNDIAQYSQANLNFHAMIHSASGNQWLISQLKQIQIHINAYRSIPYEVRGRLSESTREHREICEAILSGKGTLASNLMRDHMMLQGNRLPSVIKLLSART